MQPTIKQLTPTTITWNADSRADGVTQELKFDLSGYLSIDESGQCELKVRITSNIENNQRLIYENGLVGPVRNWLRPMLEAEGIDLEIDPGNRRQNGYVFTRLVTLMRGEKTNFPAEFKFTLWKTSEQKTSTTTEEESPEMRFTLTETLDQVVITASHPNLGEQPVVAKQGYKFTLLPATSAEGDPLERLSEVLKTTIESHASAMAGFDTFITTPVEQYTASVAEFCNSLIEEMENRPEFDIFLELDDATGDVHNVMIGVDDQERVQVLQVKFSAPVAAEPTRSKCSAPEPRFSISKVDSRAELDLFQFNIDLLADASSATGPTHALSDLYEVFRATVVDTMTTHPTDGKFMLDNELMLRVAQFITSELMQNGQVTMVMSLVNDDIYLSAKGKSLIKVGDYIATNPKQKEKNPESTVLMRGPRGVFINRPPVIPMSRNEPGPTDSLSMFSMQDKNTRSNQSFGQAAELFHQEQRTRTMAKGAGIKYFIALAVQRGHFQFIGRHDDAVPSNSYRVEADEIGDMIKTLAESFANYAAFDMQLVFDQDAIKFAINRMTEVVARESGVLACSFQAVEKHLILRVGARDFVIGDIVTIPEQTADVSVKVSKGAIAKIEISLTGFGLVVVSVGGGAMLEFVASRGSNYELDSNEFDAILHSLDGVIVTESQFGEMLITGLQALGEMVNKRTYAGRWFVTAGGEVIIDN